MSQSILWRDDAAAAMPRPARVLFVDHASRLSGAELVLLDVVKSYSRDSTVLLFEEGPLRERLNATGIRTVLAGHAKNLAAIRRDRSLLAALPSVAGMLRLALDIFIEARAHDIVYANSQKAFVLAAPVAFIARRPLVWHLHDILAQPAFAAAQIRLVMWLARHCAARVIVPSQAAADVFLSLNGDPERLTVVPNGIDLEPETAAPADLRRELGLPGGFLFGVFSRFAPWKGQHIALQALKAIPDARCVLVGDALFGEDDYRAELHRLVTELGVSDRVIFLGHRNDVPRLMRAVDVVVHPSTEPEPFGRTLVEAMLSRVPVVAANNGAAPTILDAGSAGLLVTPGDPGALVEALCTVRGNPERISDMTETAFHRARRLFSADGMRRSIDTLVDRFRGGVAR